MSDYIPEVLQLNILKLLPVKTLLRFRCVSKHWKQLIDSPSFVQQHLAVQNPRLILQYEEPGFLVVDPRSLPPLVYTLLEDRPNLYHLAGTLHGIVCLYDSYRSIYLWNPSIRKFYAVPLPQFMHYKRRSNPHQGYGDATYSAFWIHPSTKEYKIILFVGNDMAIYSSIDRKWKEVPLGEVWKCRPLKECPAVVIEGVAYWRALLDEVGKDVVVLSFDFGLERFDIIEAPSVIYQLWYHPVLCTWEGTLSLVYVDSLILNRLDIYVRQGGLWVHKFGCNLTPSIGRVLWVVGEMDERCKVVATVGAELLLCDIRVGSVYLKSGFRELSNSFLAGDFVESLLFP